MTKTDTVSTRELRRSAEKKTRLDDLSILKVQFPEGSQDVLQELLVNQVELEMQNEELRLTQQELVAAKARYFDLYDLAPVGYLTLNKNGLILEANLTAATMLGVVRNVLLKNVLSKFIFSQDKDAYLRHRRRLFETGDAQEWEMRMVRADGSCFWAHAQTTTSAHNEECLITFTNSTELRCTQSELAASRARYFELYNMAPVGYLTITEKGIVMEANLTAATMLGVGLELVKQPLTRYIHAEDQDIFQRYCTGLLNNLLLESCELRMRKEDGSQLWVIIRAIVAPQNEHGEIVLRAAVSDITLRKHLEQEKMRALETAKTSHDTMKRLMTTVAHEFRTSLGLLVISTEILDNYRDRLTPESRLKQHEDIRSAALQLTNLMNSLLSFNHIQTGSSAKPALVLDIVKICTRIAAEVETVWGTGQTYTFRIAEDCGTALLDENLFQRILQNLLTNAFRYTPSGGTVSLHVSREKNNLLIVVADTGIGIPEEDQAFIFDAFYRCLNVNGRRGLGLGLSIVHEALIQMGGAISVSSKAGAGTTMSVTLPVAEAMY